ncbi:MAG: NYN domain-containing protein [Gemmatimonadales bacterium]
MTNPYTRAPHFSGPYSAGFDSPHAALLIDFDNVTMGMRSDLSKELKNLLSSDVIKGKVSVQRAYADWRRYPQYIVPLSEASVDLIFAPAYGSNKKNATDIRMAIDALELVFTRPEIGTFILLTGDSDFSSLVLKLKEYGKYVIGVGIQESSSDILVQNCDEYYSYTSLTGLTKTTDLQAQRARDPWALAKDAVSKMVSRGDVMRSDRLKQVMQELDPNFDEGAIGFSKFSKFLSEAASRGLIELIKLGNGQYEVGPAKGDKTARGQEPEPRSRRGRGGRRERRDAPAATPTLEPQPIAATAGGADDPLQGAYALLRGALERLRESGREPARDSDVKRRILDLAPDFDETELGFPKFSRFLSQAEEHGIVRLGRGEGNGLEVSLAGGSLPEQPRPPIGATPEPAHGAGPEDEMDDFDAGHAEAGAAEPALEPPPSPPVTREPVLIDLRPEDAPSDGGLQLGPRGGSTRRREHDDPPPVFAGQGTPAQNVSTLSEGPLPAGSLEGLGLPSEPDAIVRYLTHRYKGVGDVTAQMLVERYGSGLFAALRDDAQAVASIIPAGRGEQLIEAWKADYERRTQLRDGGGNGNDRSETRRRGGRGRARGRPRD